MWARRKCVGIILLLFLSVFSLAITLLPENVSAITRYVGGGGPDNYTTIQAAIDDADPGDTVYVYNGTYYEHVIINKTLSLVGEDSNTTIIDGSLMDDVIHVEANWVNVTGFTITHSGPNSGDSGIELVFADNCTFTGNIALDNMRGFSLAHSHGNTLYGNTFVGNFAYGIFAYLSRYSLIVGNNIWSGANGIHLDNSNDSAIIHNLVSYNYIGIRITSSRNITIEHNEAVDNDDWGIYLWSSTEILVNENNASDNRVGIWTHFLADSTILSNIIVGNADSGISIERSTNVTIAGNNASNNRDGALIYSLSQSLLVGNTFSSNSWFGIRAQGSSDIAFVNNTISRNDWGIVAEGCLNLTFTANAFQKDGIYLMGNVVSNYNSHTITADNHVSNLPIYYHKNQNDFTVDNIPTGQLIVANCANVTAKNLTIANTDAGIQMAYVQDAWISNGNFSSNEQGGIYVYMSSNITIAESNFSYNLNGVRVTMSNTTIKDSNFAFNKRAIHIVSNNVTVLGNSISENYCGIRVHNSTGLEISMNDIYMNSNTGIRLVGVSDTRVYHNNIIENPVQAEDWAGPENSWDDGYPSGGNYWSDYTGVDNCSGPNQDICPDPDGKGDTPYVIDADSQDNYPLMSPIATAYPRPPRILGAVLSGPDSQNVTLTWSLSPDDGAGSESVVGYEIYRNVTYSPIGSGYELLGFVPNGTSEFTDNETGEDGAYYRVCAVDSYGRLACAINQAGKYTRKLHGGPNLVSIPLVQSDESIETVLQAVRYDKAWSYDSLSEEWKWHMAFKTYRRGLWSMNHTMGLWVNVTGPSSLTVAGIVPAKTEIHLSAGWNLVSFPSFNTNYTVSDLKMETGATRVEGTEIMPPFPPSYLRVLGDADVLQTGYGYWVKVQADMIWAIDNR